MTICRRAIVVLALAVLCFGGGAVSAGEVSGKPSTLFSWQAKHRPWYMHVLWYLPSRAADLLDIVGIELAGGMGVHANVHASRYLQLGMGREFSSRAGLMSRYPVVVDSELDEKALGWHWRLDVRRTTLLGQAPSLEIGDEEARAAYHKEFDPAAIGGSAFAGLLGMSAEVKLSEAIDFALGFLTIDTLGDDY